MADEIILKAPDIEPQVTITISGESKIKDVVDTLDFMLNGKNLQHFWKSEQLLLSDLEKASKEYLDKKNETHAEEVVKTANAYKALTNHEPSLLELNFEDIISEAKGVASCLDSCYSVMSFKNAFSAFEVLQAYGLDMEKLFNTFGGN